MNDMASPPKAMDQVFVPAIEYRDPALDLRERERLWPRVWQLACRETEILKVGDFVNYQILDDSILVVRTGAGEDDLAAFHNVCQHRGRRLREEAHGNLGTSAVCRFHGWSYSLKGELKSIYVEEDWAGCPNFDRSQLNIPVVQIARWGGWVWVNMDPEAEPFDTWLGDLGPALSHFDFAALRPLWWKTVLAPVNWKVVVEAFIEGYHSGATHTSGVSYWSLRSPTAVRGNHAVFFSEAVDFTPYRDKASEEGGWLKPRNFRRTSGPTTGISIIPWAP